MWNACASCASETPNNTRVTINICDTLAGIAAGDIYGTVVQIPTRFGYEAVFRMDKYLCGDKAQLSQGKILFNSLPVNKAKVDNIKAWRQNVLSP